ncbi:MAG: type VI secretion system baseplate subunit TssG [Acidobacteriota bacterium]
MSAEDRQAASRLKESIKSEAYRFDFFQLVYLLEHWRRGANPETSGTKAPPAIGREGPMAAETLRLRPDRGLGFSPADVRWAGPLPAKEDESGALRRFDRDGEIYQIIVNFMGLYGFTTPTPIYFTELINSPDFDSGPLTELLDLFNHRLLSFYYRAWQKYRYPYRYEPGARDEVSEHILSFVGLRERKVQEQTELPVPRLIRYIGLMAPRPRPLINLRLILADYFRLPQIRIKPWVLRWTPIAKEQCNAIGGRNCSLGEDLTVGAEIPDRSGKFRVRIGPLSFVQFKSFLPDGEKFRQLSALVHLWAGNRFDFDFEFVIRRQDIPPAKMQGADGARLGWTGWITSGAGLDHDPSVIFSRRHPALN